MQSKGSIPPLLVGVLTCTSTLEISMSVSQKIGNQSISRPSNTTLRHIPKGCTLIPQGYLLNCIHNSIVHNGQNPKKPRCLSIKEWIKKMWYIYTMEYYSGFCCCCCCCCCFLKKQCHLEICRKMDGTRKNILHEVTQTQIEKHDM